MGQYHNGAIPYHNAENPTTLHEPMKVRGEDNHAPTMPYTMTYWEWAMSGENIRQYKTYTTNLKTIHIMFTFDIKAIRNEYENLSLLVEKENNTASEKDLTTRAKSISNEDFQQIFSEQHGGVVDTITKSTDNAIFTILLDNTKGELSLSPYINIKDPNGIVVITWNIEDETMTLIPLLK